MSLILAFTLEEVKLKATDLVEQGMKWRIGRVNPREEIAQRDECVMVKTRGNVIFCGIFIFSISENHENLRYLRSIGLFAPCSHNGEQHKQGDKTDSQNDQRGNI